MFYTESDVTRRSPHSRSSKNVRMSRSGAYAGEGPEFGPVKQEADSSLFLSFP